MVEPIYFVLEGHNRILRPAAFTKALQGFLRLLRELDASISHSIMGSVDWEIVSLQKSSPAVIGYLAHPRARRGPAVDRSDDIKRTCVSGLDLLSKKPERLGEYSDRALDRTEYLAKLRATDRFDEMRVLASGQEANVSVATLANIQTLKGPTYESAGSVVGKLEAISVHHAFEFRVWSEVTGKPVTCRFDESMFDKVKDRLRHKVTVYGLIKWNALGHPISVSVEGMDLADSDSEMTIEQVSGAIDDFTEGMTLADYLEDLRNG